MSSFQIISLYLQNWVYYTEYTLYCTITTIAGRFIGVGWTLQILVTFTALEIYAETMTLEIHSAIDTSCIIFIYYWVLFIIVEHNTAGKAGQNSS